MNGTCLCHQPDGGPVCAALSAAYLKVNICKSSTVWRSWSVEEGPGIVFRQRLQGATGGVG